MNPRQVRTSLPSYPSSYPAHLSPCVYVWYTHESPSRLNSQPVFRLASYAIPIHDSHRIFVNVFAQALSLRSSIPSASPLLHLDNGRSHNSLVLPILWVFADAGALLDEPRRDLRHERDAPVRVWHHREAL